MEHGEDGGLVPAGLPDEPRHGQARQLPVQDLLQRQDGLLVEVFKLLLS